MPSRTVRSAMAKFDRTVQRSIVKSLDRSYFEGASIAAKEIGSGIPVFDSPSADTSRAAKSEVLEAVGRFNDGLQDALESRLAEEGTTMAQVAESALTEPITAMGASGKPFRMAPKSYLNTLARTAPYRMKVLGYAENSLAQGSIGWIWVAEPDACDDCLEKHGSVHDWGDPMPPDDSHPNCRCFPKAIYADAEEPTEVEDVQEED